MEPLAELKFDPGFRVIREYLSQSDSILIVKLTNILTLNIESIWLKYSPITRNPGFKFSSAMQWLNFLGQNDSIFLSVLCYCWLNIQKKPK